MESSSMSASEWQKCKDQVLSWMDNELRCVTAQRISQSLDLARKQGSLLLEEILNEREESKSQITYCRKSKQGNATVFRLESSTTPSKRKKDENDDDGSTTLFALASTEATEMVATAHERDMVQWREMVDTTGKSTLLSSSSNTTIAPAEQLTQVKATEGKYDDAAYFEDGASVSKSKATPTFQKPFAGKKAKAVTAAAFFAKNTKSTTTSTTAKKKPASTSTSHAVTKKPVNPSKTREEEKENKKNQKTVTKNRQNKKVGNADEFVADEEDSDDEEVKVVKRKPARVAPAPKDEEDDTLPPSPSPAIHGAMDDFATKKQPEPQQQQGERRRKRRKKMVEKTTVVNGYLRTEVQAVWEDIPTDEEEEEQRQQQQKQLMIAKKKTQPTKAKNAQQMKQKSLVGFFSKKK